jgi:hypothetical protein
VVAVTVVDRVGVVADSVLVTVFVVEAAVVLEVSVAAVAVLALVVVLVGVVGDADPVVVWLAVLLVICVRLFEMLLAMLDAPPEPHPATRTARALMNANLTSID